MDGQELRAVEEDSQGEGLQENSKVFQDEDRL